MPINVLTNPDNTSIVGSLSVANSPTAPQTAQAVATGTAAISVPPNCSSIKLTAAAATTGASLPAGMYDGQLLFITITTAAANTVTFAASGTSNVAGGTAASLAGLSTHILRWDAAAALWFQVGPLAN